MAEDAPINLLCNEVIIDKFIEPQPFAREEDELQKKMTEEESVTGSGGKRLGKRKYSRVGDKGKLEKAKQARDVKYGRKDKDPIHTVLPMEIRCKILKEFQERELLQLRLVSQTWKATVDSILKVHVKIDGNNKEFKGKCGLAIQSCQLVSLQDPAHRHLFRGPCPEEVCIIRGICQVNFEEMVLRWSLMTKLELCWRSTMKNLLFGRSVREGASTVRKNPLLPNLKVLNIEMLANDSLGDRTKSRIVSNITLLTSYEYPSLAKCLLSFVHYRTLHAENRYLSVLLPFLNRHANSLETVDFTLEYATHTIYPPPHPRHILFCVPANLKNYYRAPHNALDSKLVTTQLQKQSKSPEHHLEWVEMLKNTRKLEVAIMTRFLSWSIKHLEFFSPTIRDYCKFLRCVELMNITMYDSGAHNTVTQLDAKVFCECSQLIRLHMYRAPIIFHEDEVEPSAEMINFHLLPKTLQNIVVDGLPISSSEIIVAIQELKDLSSFDYFQSQVPRRNLLWTNGINWEALQAILQHPKLKTAKVHVSTFEQVRFQYEQSFKNLCEIYSWNSAEIVSGYMSMHQITLSKEQN